MRCAAKRSNGTPRASSYRRAASTRPSASTSEFVTVDVAGKLHGHLEDDVFHEGKVLLDQRRQLDIHRARTLAGLRPHWAGSDASSPIFVVALVHRPRGLSIAIRGVSEESTTTLSDSSRFLSRRSHQRHALVFQTKVEMPSKRTGFTPRSASVVNRPTVSA